MALSGPTLPARVGLVIGVANKRSIAWAIAKAASLEGAQLAIADLLAERYEAAKGVPDAGVVYSMAYGDQPALTCDLVDWARTCGFSVVAAGFWGVAMRVAWPRTAMDGVDEAELDRGALAPPVVRAGLAPGEPDPA